MKITAGLAHAEQYPLYVKAGADEVFCGYVPLAWTEKYGLTWPLNRREARRCPVQIGSRSELRVLASMIRDMNAPAALTFNSLCYLPKQYPVIADIISQCLDDGFSTFILADPGLMTFLREQGLTGRMHIHVSGEAGEINRFSAEVWRTLGAERVIFHRHAGIGNMASVIRADREAHPEAPLCFEAFAMNEKCYFTGAFCSGLHCDEMCHPCHLPWRLGPVGERDRLPEAAADMPAGTADTAGFSGCGLCALPRLRAAGVQVLKAVGRGADTGDMVRDIMTLKKAAEMAENADSAGEKWTDKMKAACFPEGCGGECYYC